MIKKIPVFQVDNLLVFTYTSVIVQINSLTLSENHISKSTYVGWNMRQALTKSFKSAECSFV